MTLETGKLAKFADGCAVAKVCKCSYYSESERESDAACNYYRPHVSVGR